VVAVVRTKATLQDVADAAGVHRSTVSLALRDHPRISPAVRQRIHELAERLGYRVNPLVAALMASRRTGRETKHVTLAYITNYPTRYGWRPPHHDRPDFFPGAQARALDFGYRLEDFWLAEPGMTPERMAEILTARGIHGLIIGRLPPGQATLTLDWQRFSCVALGMTLTSPVLHHVTENHFSTVRQSLQRCRERGYRRPGFVFSGANDSPRVGDRWMGAFLSQQQYLPVADRIPMCPAVPADLDTFSKWFRKHRPDVLVAPHVRPMMDWLNELGIEVPRDVGLVGLEWYPSLDCAGVRHDPAKIGGLAVEMLLGLMHRNETGVPSDQHEVLLTGKWHEGSTLPPR
jgi:LacI family transcriptional regulator